MLAARPARTNRFRLSKIWIGILAVFVVVATVLAVLLLTPRGTSSIPQAIQSCVGDLNHPGVNLAADQKSVFLNGSGEVESFKLSEPQEYCVLQKLNLPGWLINEMRNSKGDGSVQAFVDDYEVNWVFSVRQGLDINLKQKR